MSWSRMVVPFFSHSQAPDAMIGHNEAKPLELSRRELMQLEAFLRTLEAPVTFAGAE